MDPLLLGASRRGFFLADLIRTSFGQTSPPAADSSRNKNNPHHTLGMLGRSGAGDGAAGEKEEAGEMRAPGGGRPQPRSPARRTVSQSDLSLLAPGGAHPATPSSSSSSSSSSLSSKASERRRLFVLPPDSTTPVPTNTTTTTTRPPGECAEEPSHGSTSASTSMVNSSGQPQPRTTSPRSQHHHHHQCKWTRKRSRSFGGESGAGLGGPLLADGGYVTSVYAWGWSSLSPLMPTTFQLCPHMALRFTMMVCMLAWCAN